MTRLVLCALLVAGLQGCSTGSQPATGASTKEATSASDERAPAPEERKNGQRKPIQFTDVTATSGIAFTMTSGNNPSQQIVDAKGGGLALIDFDRDGDNDLFVPNGATSDAPEHGPGARLWENLGNLRFRDVTADAGITMTRWGIGVAVGDYDGNGFDDLYITCHGPNVLLRNLGNGRFEDVSAAAGVDDKKWGTACAFGDIDRDGDLDLYVSNYVEFNMQNPPAPSEFFGTQVFAGPTGLPPQSDVLFENLGDGTFRDIVQESRCAEAAPSYGLGVVMLDFDDDGWMDIYVGNDSMANFLFVNQGDGTFAESGASTGIGSNEHGSNQATMGIGIADVTGNGLIDLFTTNFSNDSNTLHTRDASRFFGDRTRRFGLGMISRPYVGWACGFYDFDLDTDEDLLIFNGHVYPFATMATVNSEYRQTPLLFRREGARFKRVTADESGTWLAEPHCDRGAVFGDLDNDGDVDVVVAELNGPLRVLRNDQAPGRWLTVRLADSQILGTRLELVTGDLKQRRWIYGGGSFVSASAQAAYFGLPDDEAPSTLHIRWPDGATEVVENIAANKEVVIGTVAPLRRLAHHF